MCFSYAQRYVRLLILQCVRHSGGCCTLRGESASQGTHAVNTRIRLKLARYRGDETDTETVYTSSAERIPSRAAQLQLRSHREFLDLPRGPQCGTL